MVHVKNIKFLELILMLAVFTLHYKSDSTLFENDTMLVSGTVVGYLIIIIGMNLGGGGEGGGSVSQKVNLFYMILGCILMLVIGLYSVKNTHDDDSIGGIIGSLTENDWGNAMGFMAVFLGITMGIDAAVSLK